MNDEIKTLTPYNEENLIIKNDYETPDSDLIQTPSKANKNIPKKKSSFFWESLIKIVLSLYSLIYSILMPILVLKHYSKIDPKKDDEILIYLWICLSFLYVIYNILIIISIIYINNCIFRLLIIFVLMSFVFIIVNPFFYGRLKEKIEVALGKGIRIYFLINGFLMIGIVFLQVSFTEP